MKKYTIAILFIIFSNFSSADPITELNITGGSVDFPFINPGSTFTLGALTSITIGDYDGSPPLIPNDFFTTSIVNYQFLVFADSATAFTAPSDGYNSGFAPPTGDITNGIATLNLDSWTAWWNGTSFNQGSNSAKGANETCVDDGAGGVTRCSTPIVVSYDDVTGAFTATWSSVVVGGPFNGSYGNWVIEGTMFAEPQPDCDDINGDGVVDMADVVILYYRVLGNE